ncbi:META domain-containing protein [Spirosoma sp. KNUC1025]|uniref:META domain-containing protein n=1 Tax=Spirosoma sp. KNUC1025 TaxID=2894082 RepID=UPI00386E18C8|nr:META domain-containing protein [Spirosoma sp. KNUC1025]
MKLQLVITCLSILCLLTVACKSAKTAGISLTNTHWILVEVNGQPVIHAGLNKEASLQLAPEGNKLTGSTSCNRMFGTYTLSGNEKIQFSGIGSTRMACPDMSTETAFLKALEATNSYGISGKELLLKNDRNVVARLRVESF